MTRVKRREVDAVVVWRLDRLFRSMRHLLDAVAEFTALGVDLESMHEQIDLTTPGGRLMVGVLAALGEFERDLIRARVIAGLENARAKGKKLGRPTRHDPDVILKLRAEGRSYSEIVKLTGAPRGTVCRVISAGRKTPSPESSPSATISTERADS